MSTLDSTLSVATGGGSRRSPPRWFPIEQDVHYKGFKGGKVCLEGTGRTVEISSHEVRFTAPHAFRLRQTVLLAVNWPALVDQKCPLKLEIAGWVVRRLAGALGMRAAELGELNSGIYTALSRESHAHLHGDPASLRVAPDGTVSIVSQKVDEITKIVSVSPSKCLQFS